MIIPTKCGIKILITLLQDNSQATIDWFKTNETTVDSDKFQVIALAYLRLKSNNQLQKQPEISWNYC